MVKTPKIIRRVHDDAFRREAVRILATSGRQVEHVARDLGVARSSLSKWKAKFAEAELMAGPHDDVCKELARLRRENELLRAERDLFKKATVLVCAEHSFAMTPRKQVGEVRPDRCKEY